METKKEKSLKNKKLVYIVIAVAIILLFVGAGAFFLSLKKQTASPAQSTDQTQNVKTVSADDIGLTLAPRSDDHAVVMDITKLDGVESVEYEVSYDAYVTDQGPAMVTPRGVVGSPIQVNGSTIHREIELGTCSRSVCKYDQVVSDVKFDIKINYKDGSVGSVEKSFTMPGTDKSLDNAGSTDSGSSSDANQDQ